MTERERADLQSKLELITQLASMPAKQWWQTLDDILMLPVTYDCPMFDWDETA